MKAQSHLSGIVEYASPRTVETRLMHGPVAATVLLMPGLICWIGYLSIVNPFSKLRWSGAPIVGLMWPIAVVSAFVSLSLYLPRHRRRNAYVWINLAINIPGLIFTALCPFYFNFLFGF